MSAENTCWCRVSHHSQSRHRQETDAESCSVRSGPEETSSIDRREWKNQSPWVRTVYFFAKGEIFCIMIKLQIEDFIHGLMKIWYAKKISENCSLVEAKLRRTPKNMSIGGKKQSLRSACLEKTQRDVLEPCHSHKWQPFAST